MRNYFRNTGILLVFFLFHSSIILASTYPSPTGYVNDFANILSSETKQTLETTLSNYSKETNHEISVVTITSLEGTDIETYAVKLFEQWKIGKKGADNGVLLLVSKDDRKIRIEVGYGLEGALTDGKSGEIIRELITPAFQEGNYDKGITDGADGIMAAIKGEEIPLPPNESGGNNFKAILTFGFIFFNIFASYLAGFLGRTKAVWPGGVIGAILGFIGGAILFTMTGGIITAIIFAILGLVFDSILSKNYKERTASGLPTTFGSSWGGFGGGKSGGGGFGGFGGGRSGGGGASGGW
jgi:uncharacterized protein